MYTIIIRNQHSIPMSANRFRVYIYLRRLLFMKLVPLGDKVVIKQLEAEEKTKSGLILTSQSQEKPQEAMVIAVGPGGLVGDTEVKMVLKEGDRVVYSKYAGTEIKFEGETYIVIKQNDILAKVEQ